MSFFYLIEILYWHKEALLFVFFFVGNEPDRALCVKVASNWFVHFMEFLDELVVTITKKKNQNIPIQNMKTTFIFKSISVIKI